MGETLTGLKRPIASPESILANGPEPVQGSAEMSETPPTPPVVPQATPAVVKFVKNINPSEKIVFKDKTTFRFPRPLFVCDDPKLIEKILEVADQYNIVQQ